jgi:hypothetical protein
LPPACFGTHVAKQGRADEVTDPRPRDHRSPVLSGLHHHYGPGFLEPRRMAEKALTGVVQEAYVRASPPARSTSWCRRWG